ncbi:hypothetical protein ACIQU4_30770 [Streptomyces sp. NPDC090741]|uniref:hypothetical protein n=1 Tax=Streptomyces sp. NPDC090741 TaxID=3365967 RepID=UPI003818C06A
MFRQSIPEPARRAGEEQRDPATARLWGEAAPAAMAGDGPDDEAIDALLRGHLPLVRAGGAIGLRASVELPTDADPALRRIASQRVQSLWSPHRPPGLPQGDPEVAALLDRCTGVSGEYVMGRMRSRLGIPRTASGPTG